MKLRKTAALSTLALAATTLVATGGTATAATTSLAYACTVPILGANTFDTVVDTSAPATAKVGDKIKTVTSKVAVSASMMGAAYNLGARSVAGSADVTIKVGGSPVTVTLPIPKTQIPATGPLNLTISGPLNAVLRKAGVVKVDAGKYVAHMNIFTADGSPLGILPKADVPCTPPTGVSLTANTVQVAKTTTKTKVKAKAVGKGMAKVTVKVKGSKPGGKVKVTLKGAKKVTKKAKVKQGKAVITVKKLKKGKYKITAAYSGDKANKASKGTGKVRIKK